MREHDGRVKTGSILTILAAVVAGLGFCRLANDADILVLTGIWSNGDYLRHEHLMLRIECTDF